MVSRSSASVGSDITWLVDELILDKGSFSFRGRRRTCFNLMASLLSCVRAGYFFRIFDDLMEKFIGIHFLLQLAQRFCGLHQFCCKNSAGSVSRVEPTGAAVDRQRSRRLKFSSHDPFVIPVSAIDPSLIASSGAKPSRAEFFQTKTERI